MKPNRLTLFGEIIALYSKNRTHNKGIPCGLSEEILNIKACSLRQILEKKWEHNGVMHTPFIDFKKDYD